MKKRAITVFAAFLWAAIAATQTPGPSGLAKDAILQTELAKTIDAKNAKPGDEVTARLTQDVLMNGKIILPRGTKVMGHVSEAQPHSKEHPEARLVLVFDKIAVKGGEEVARNFVIAAVAPPVAVQQASVRSDNLGVPQSMGSKGNLSGGPVGGVPSTAGAGARNPAATDTATPSINAGSGNAGGDPGPQGVLNSASRGVVGIDGLSLDSNAGSAPASILKSTKKNLKLESGTQLLLQALGVAP
ncbi:MAG TPA: hypothetical protein VF532_09870 [Candidatus Angelobacter sp.]